MKFKLIILTLLFLINSSASADLKLGLMEAQSLFLKVLSSSKELSFDGLEASDRYIVYKHLNNFLYELENSKIKVVENDNGFLHLNKKTWIETDLKSGGDIRIAVNSNIFSGKKTNFLDMTTYLAHELAHHIVIPNENQDIREIESQCWKIANAFVSLLINNLNFPELMNLSFESYRKSKLECQDEMKIEKIDPIKGRLTVQFNTKETNCRVSDRYMESYLKRTNLLKFLNLLDNYSDMFIFNNLRINYQCFNDDGKLYCADERPDKINSHCDDFLYYLKAHKMKFPFGLHSMMEIINDGSLKASTSWCTEDMLKYAGFHAEIGFYSLYNKPVSLTLDERNKKNEENSSKNFVGKLLFIKEKIKAMEAKKEQAGFEEL